MTTDLLRRHQAHALRRLLATEDVLAHVLGPGPYHPTLELTVVSLRDTSPAIQLLSPSSF
jgi:hypothetical protein